MKHFFVFEEYLCKNCGNKYHLPVWYWKNNIQGFGRAPKMCECGKSDFKYLGYNLSQSKMDYPRGKPLMAEGKASTRNYLFVFSLIRCTKCKAEQYFQMAINKGKLTIEEAPHKCAKKYLEIVKHKLGKKAFFIEKPQMNFIMVKK